MGSPMIPDALIQAWPAFRLSLELATAASGFVVLLGVPLAWLLATRRFPGRRALEAAFLLPLALPPTVLGYYLLLLLGSGGPLARATGLQWAFSFPGLVVGAVLFSLPLSLSTFREVFLRLDPDLLDTARTLGARPLARFRRVVLPLAWPGLLSGAVLAFAHTLGEFGVVLMIGGSIPGRTQVASIYLYDLVQALEFGAAGVVAGTLLAVAFVTVFALRILEERWRSASPSRTR